MRVLVLGRSRVLLESARRLAEGGAHRVAAVITAPAGGEQGADENAFRCLAADCHAPFLLKARIDEEALALLRETACEVGVSINWVSVLGGNVLALLPYGVLNAHYGDLPRFRGNAVANWAILLGEPDVAVTIHRMEADRLDAGPILAQERVRLDGQTDIAAVLRFAEARVPAMFAHVLDGLDGPGAAAAAPAEAQRAGFRCYPRLPRDGRIDWNQPASRIHALVAAVSRPFSGAYTYYRTSADILEELYVWQSRVVTPDTPDVGVPGHLIHHDPETGESHVLAGRGILALREVSHGANGPPFAPGRTWRSIRMRLGMDIEGEIFRLVRRGPSPGG